MKTAFLSYSWANEKTADEIDNVFQSLGIEVKRDKRELGYKDDIKNYMQSIRGCDYAILVISEASLKSQACMYEVLEIMKEQEFVDKILPIIVAGTKLFKPEDQISFINHWKEQSESLEKELKEIGIAEGMSLASDLKIRKSIYSNIAEFLKIISDRNVPPFDVLKSENFQSIKDYLGLVKGGIHDEVLEAISPNNDLETSEINIEELEKKYPERFEIYVAKGHLEFQGKKYKKAINSYLKVVNLNPNFENGWYNLGCMYEWDGNKEEAINALEKASELGSSNSRVYNNLGGLYEDSDKKIENYTKAITFSPHDDVAYYNLGTLYAKQDETELAIENLKKAIDLNPENHSARLNIGLVYKKTKEFEEAIKWFESILEIDRYNSSALIQLARLYEETEIDINKARIFYESYLAIEKDDAYEHKAYFIFLYKHFREEEDLIKQVLHYANFLEEKKKYLEEKKS